MSTQSKESYTDLRDRHKKELLEIPMGFAFNDKQFTEMLSLLKADTVKDILCIGGGGYIHRNDDVKLNDMVDRQKKELDEALKDRSFARQAFLYELRNHEFSYTYDPKPAINTLGLTIDKVKNNNVLYTAYSQAVHDIYVENSHGLD